MSHSQSDSVDCPGKKWTVLRLLKTILLAGVVLFALCSFILIPEKKEEWINIAPKQNDTIYLNLTNELDLINPVWTIKARSAFLPAGYSSYSKKYVNFTLIRLKNGEEVSRHKKPWTVAVASSRPNQDIVRTELEHSFILSTTTSINDPDFDPDFVEHIFDEGSDYQLEVVTNDAQPVAIALTLSAYSELSLKGVIMAGCILVLLYVLIIFEVVHRTLAAMIGATAAIACLTIIHDRPSLEKVMSWLDTETLTLLFGMMIMVAILCETGFFDYIAVLAFRLARGQIWPLMTILCIFTGVLSAFLDNVTTVLLMTPVTIKLCEIKNIDPKHVLIAQVIFSNIGGAATPVGDPPNVIIISSHVTKSLGVGFTTFVAHVGPGIIVCFVVALLLVKFMYRDVSKFAFSDIPEVVECGARNEVLHHRMSQPNLTNLRIETELAESTALLTQSHPPVTPTYKSITFFANDGFPYPESTFARNHRIDLQHEIQVWKKARNSIGGYSRDEKTVRGALTKKVLALEQQLRSKLDEDEAGHEIDYFENLAQLQARYRIKNKPLLIKSGIVMGICIILFFLQGLPNMDLSLGWIAILGAISLLTLADFEELEAVIARVEWSTLIFFASLFVVMEALEKLKFLWWIGQMTQHAINSFSDDYKLIAAIIIILWVSALASSFIDNIPFATVMIKIIDDIAQNGDMNVPITPLIYALAFGACLGGNGTLIGASANVVCAGVAEHHGYRFTFMDFFKVGFPVMLVTTFIANIYLIICHVWLSWN